ncbi:MAG: murein transglycosylase [Bacteroidetes bacterium 4572_77]|nr:MAG: murein transglycosylase [Bacteroidetes bacterium 4572_77]
MNLLLKKPHYGVLSFLVLFSFVLFSFISPSKHIPKDIATNNKVTDISLPQQLTFAGEKVPLDKFYIREALEHELTVNTYWHSATILLIKRANRWFPVIEPILKKHGIPEDFKYLAVAESGLLNVVSPAGATGFWQIMKTTAREYGLEVNDGIDQRYHVEKSTEVACAYLQKAYDKYGSWSLAAASYNAGMNRISKELKRQGEDNYYDMIFGQETGRYVFRIIALKLVMSQAKDYGFHLDKKLLYMPYETYEITIDTTINDLPAFAKSYGLSYKELKIYNPWMRQAYMPDKSRRKYKIKLPVSSR